MQIKVCRFCGVLLVLLFSVGGVLGQNPFDIRAGKKNSPPPTIVLPQSDSVLSHQDTVTDKPVDSILTVDSSAIIAVDTISELALDSTLLDSVLVDSIGLRDSLDSFKVDTTKVISVTPAEPQVEDSNPAVQNNNKAPWYAPWIDSDRNSEEKGSTGMLTAERITSYVYIFLLLGLIAFLVNFDRPLFESFFKAFTNTNDLRILYREEYLKNQGLFIVHYVVYVMSLGFLVYRGAEYLLDLRVPGLLLLSVLVVLILVAIRHLVLLFVIWMTNESFDYKFYNFEILVSNIVIGYLLVPIDLVLGFGPESIFPELLLIGVGIVVLLYFYRQIRAFMISSNTISVHTFQFFLYLCAFEIFPLLIVIKMATEGSNL